MSKLFGVIIACFAASAAYAQLFSFQTTTKAPPAGQTDNKPAPALTSDEFKSKVSEKSKQVQQELVRQAQSALKDQEGQSPFPMSAPKAPKLNQIQKVEPAASLPAQSASPSSPEALGPPSAPREELPAAAPETAAAPAPPPPPPTSTSAPLSSQPAPSQGQVYTGFGTSPTPNNTGGTSSSSGGGWNIKY
ncbi:MAG TPA: hypothetical protein VLI69_02660 [Gammaproteobacteria bacterium]|nr:hypothetical protein [Gammaproteobacteria bacterium]